MTRTTPVRRAARLLDRRKPSWFKRIVYRRLDLGDGTNCVCGQAGLNWRELQDEYARRFPGDDAAPFADNLLRDEWIAEIRRRRAKAEA